jgi:hypothetical protein
MPSHPCLGDRSGELSGAVALSRSRALPRSRVSLPRLGALLGAVVLAGCAGFGAPQGPAAGTAQADVLARWGQPTARYTLPGGGTRLEYATGPFGRTTWMVDTDGAGRVVQSRQVLNERDFLELQQQEGLDREGVLRRIGTPGERQAIGWTGGEFWSWRYPTNDCLWFQVSFTREGRVNGSGYGIDPRCDAPSNRD